jgi:capsular polysaccharide biosynthesis protein
VLTEGHAVTPEAFAAILLRRWYVLLLALLLTAAGAYHVLRPTQVYRATTVVVLKPPVTGNQPNQLANLQPTLATVSYDVAQQLQTPTGQAELAAAGVSGTYALAPRNSGTNATPQYLIPSLQITAEEPTPDQADAAAQRIVEVYTQHIGALQDAQHVPTTARMTVSVLVPPNAALLVGTKSRGLVGVALLGVFGGVLLALWTDRFAARRRDRARLPVAAAIPVVKA